MTDQNANSPEASLNTTQVLPDGAEVLAPEAPAKVISLAERIEGEAKKFGADVVTAKLGQLEGKLLALAHNAETRMKGFDDAMQSVVDQTNSQATKLAKSVMALEQTVLSFGKMLMAISTTLINKGHMSNSDVLTELRANEDKMESQRIDELVKYKIIELSQTSDAESVIILRQEQVLDDGSKKLVSDFRSFEIPSMQDSNPLKKELIGKTAGDGIGLVDAQGNFFYTVKAVYKLNEQGSISPNPETPPGA